MKQSIKTITIIALALMACNGYSQVNNDSELFTTLKANDSLLFEISFNKCQLSVLDNLIAEDLEFYHDQGGVTNSFSEFVSVMKNGICRENNPSKSRRELVAGSLEVFPMYSNGELYGALQIGEHRFFETYQGVERPGSVAKFSHLWLKENNHWILKRVISYDHKMQNVKKKKKIKVSQGILASYIGTYKAPKTGTVSITKNEGGLIISAEGMKSPIYPESETVFKHEQAPLTFEFVTNTTGGVSKMVVREHGEIVEEAIKQ